MYQVLPQLLDKQSLKQLDLLIQQSSWESGRGSAGDQAILVKNNLQLQKSQASFQLIHEILLEALQASEAFLALTLAHKIYPPTINRYSPEHPEYGAHYDNSVRLRSDGQRVRADLSCTVFLSDPSEYEGGELIIHEQSARHTIRLEAGSALIYPADCLHQVTAVTKGARTAAFFWIQSMVRQHAQRNLLIQLDQNIQDLRNTLGNTQQTLSLTGVYHQLLRQWAEI